MRCLSAYLILFYLSFIATGLYCHCFQETASHHDHQQMHAEAGDGHSHDHESSHEHSPDQSSTPHSCDCIGLENAVLVSSAVPELVKYDCFVSLASEPFSLIASLASPSLRFINSNHHGPPQQVPIHIKNQVFLI